MSGTNNPATITMNSNKSITANFSEITSEQTTIEVKVASNDDDAEEDSSGNVICGSWILELGEKSGPQTVGVRFAQVGLAKNAHITNAYIQFTAYSNNSSQCEITVKAEDSDNPTAYSETANNITSRAKIAGLSVSKVLPPWTAGDAGEAQRINVTSLIQNLVNRTGWTQNNAMSFIITGTGTRKASSYKKPTEAAVLHIEF